MELDFAPATTHSTSDEQRWPALVMSGERIDQEIEQLCTAPKGKDGRRRSMIVHPWSKPDDQSLAPAIDVALNVVLPGEETPAWRTNAGQVAFCIRGGGTCRVGQVKMELAPFDTWIIPSMNRVTYEGSGSEPLVFLSYSNSPLLKKLLTYYEETGSDLPAMSMTQLAGDQLGAGSRARDAALNVAIGEDGARVLGYEYLVDIDVVRSAPLLWRWSEVSQYLGEVEHLGGERGKNYQGRHLITLYNPATERRMGTTHSFFASIAQFPPGRVDVPHRHTSAAINYIFGGSGRSTVDGKKFEWKAGDLMLSAPGWAVHNHASGNKGANILTVQDHPLHIAAESLLWQETLKSPVMKLGAERGVQTNIDSLVGD